MDYLKILRENPDLAEEFDSIFDFFLLDEMTERETEHSHLTYSLDGTAFAKDGAGGEYHLLEDGSVGYHGSEGENGRLADNMEDFFTLLINSICWHDYCNANQYSSLEALEKYGQNQRKSVLEDIDQNCWKNTADKMGITIEEKLSPVLEKFCISAQRKPLYQSIYHEDDRSLTQSDSIMYE